ncbi:MAG: DUF1028 domain-containing protein [Actinomycetota bacterium]
MTFSIVARDGDAFGVAVASKFLAVGALVPWARPGAGAIATQAYANISYGPRGLALLEEGRSTEEVVAVLTGADGEREQRQLGVVDTAGNAASFTGSECITWAGGAIGEGYAVQGNILAGPGVVGSLAEAFERTDGDLAARLLAALTAGDGVGGDRRGRQSAALLVVSPGGGYGGTTDVVADLRVDDHAHPVRELARLLEIHRMLFTKPGPEDLLPLKGDLLKEVTTALVATGYLAKSAGGAERTRALERFAGWENLEERIVEGPRIDRHVLAALRAAAAAVSRGRR